MYTSYWFCFSSDIQTDRYTSYIANSLKYVLRPLLNQGKDKTFLYNQLGVVGLFYSHSQVTNVFSETDESRLLHGTHKRCMADTSLPQIPQKEKCDLVCHLCTTSTTLTKNLPRGLLILDFPYL